MRGSCSSENEVKPEYKHNFLAPGISTIKRSSIRKRKRKDCDSYSICNFDVSLNGNPRRSKLSKVSSLVSLLSPAKPMQKFGPSIQKSLSGIHISSPKAVLRPQYDESGQEETAVSYVSNSSSCKFSKRDNKLWIETIGCEKAKKLNQKFDKREIRRQEAIFEVYQGEVAMVEDLYLATKLYRDSLLHLGILSPAELRQIFGTMHTLLPVHKDLSSKLNNIRDEDLITDSIGEILLNWVSKLSCYSDYCSNLMNAKELLDAKRCADQRLEDFLQRCLESPFSRKLDLWSFIDVPRTRLMKYPLLFRNILKLTPENHPDIKTISEAIGLVEDIISCADKVAGEQQCLFYMNKIYHVNDDQIIPELKMSRNLVCSSIFRNNRGTKLHSFLFDTVLVLTRPVFSSKRGSSKAYQMYRQPIPVSQLVVEVLNDGDVKMGSFKNTFGSNNTSRNLFKVVNKHHSPTQFYILQANSDHEKKQWLSAFQKLSVGIVYPNESSASSDKLFHLNVLRSRNRNSVPVMESLSRRSLMSTTRESSDPNSIIMSSKSVYI